MNILITGGSGFIGSHLAANLLKQGIVPKVLIRSEMAKDKIQKTLKYYFNDPEKILSSVHWCYGDILDPGSLKSAIKDVTNVYHCAAFISFSKKDRKLMLDTNIRGTANIVNACLQNSIEKLVHVSSIAAIGDLQVGDALTEESGWPPGHKLNYSYSKTHGEFEVWRGIAEGLNAVIVNPSVVLGPGNWDDGSPKFFSAIYNGFKYYTRGVTGFVDVDDVVSIMIKLMESEVSAQRFILNAENISYGQLFEKIAESLSVKPPTVFAGKGLTNIARIADAIRSAVFFRRPLITKETVKSAHKIEHYSSEKIRQSLGWTFIPIEKTIERTSEFYLNDLKSKV